jgi:DNA polymerase-3 subunit gamma/tau
LSYQVIARKWRPQNFSELVGQNHISQTLTNALVNGRLPQALLFTGPRGTGKTSSARILAKALRCQNPQNFVPCGECSSCLEVTSGRATDVIEIDGASNNGVDHIRELREGVAFMPSSGKYKVYIIDEVHMLSTSAFNALLKTLEEPPEHVIFMLATTEVQKIPQTILSRCQRFDFRRISTRTIVDRMTFICKQEGISTDDESLWIIARLGDGSMRDSLSLLDQVITFSNNNSLEAPKVVEILGLSERTLLIECLSLLVNQDTGNILALTQKLAQAGTEPGLYLEDLLELIRACLVVKISAESASEILDLPDSELHFLKDLAKKTSEEDIHLLFDMALKGSQDLHRSSDPRIVLEMILLRMAIAPRIVDLRVLLSGKTLPALSYPSPTGQTNSIPSLDTSSNKPAANISPPQKIKIQAHTPAEKWYEFVQFVKSDSPLLGAKIENLVFSGERSLGNGKIALDVGVPDKLGFLKEQLKDSQMKLSLQLLVEKSWGTQYSCEIRFDGTPAEGGSSAVSVAKAKELKNESDLLEKVAAHPKVISASEVFKGSFKLKNKENT